MVLAVLENLEFRQNHAPPGKHEIHPLFNHTEDFEMNWRHRWLIPIDSLYIYKKKNHRSHQKHNKLFVPWFHCSLEFHEVQVRLLDLEDPVEYQINSRNIQRCRNIVLFSQNSWYSFMMINFLQKKDSQFNLLEYLDVLGNLPHRVGPTKETSIWYNDVKVHFAVLLLCNINLFLSILQNMTIFVQDKNRHLLCFLSFLELLTRLYLPGRKHKNILKEHCNSVLLLLTHLKIVYSYNSKVLVAICKT